jgi:hypothetical protein
MEASTIFLFFLHFFLPVSHLTHIVYIILSPQTLAKRIEKLLNSILEILLSHLLSPVSHPTHIVYIILSPQSLAKRIDKLFKFNYSNSSFAFSFALLLHLLLHLLLPVLHLLI